ncbi:MAG: hypothetical protein ACREPH_02780 [Rhodanobacteraceae bacterium]
MPAASSTAAPASSGNAMDAMKDAAHKAGQAGAAMKDAASKAKDAMKGH